jgi:hypothetical protein
MAVPKNILPQTSATASLKIQALRSSESAITSRQTTRRHKPGDYNMDLLPTYLPTYLRTHPPTYLPTYLYMALQSIFFTLAAFQFLNLYTVGRTPWTGDQPVARPLPTHRTTEIQNKRTQTSMPRVGFEPTIPVFERAKTVHTLDRAATVINMGFHHRENLKSYARISRHLQNMTDRLDDRNSGKSRPTEAKPQAWWKSLEHKYVDGRLWGPSKMGRPGGRSVYEVTDRNVNQAFHLQLLP